MNPETQFREGLDELAEHYKSVLTLLGEDADREGLQKTPMRVAKAMQILTRGYTQDPHKVLTDALFEEKYNQMVIVRDIDFFSMCEHHMLPFYGKVHVAYIPRCRSDSRFRCRSASRRPSSRWARWSSARRATCA